MTPTETLQAYYDLEINVSISSFWDAGWEFKINGHDFINYGPAWDYKEEFDILEDGFKWLESKLGEYE